MTSHTGNAQVLYLYGVVPFDQPLPQSAGAALEPISCSGVVALVEPVSASEFSPELLEEKLQKLDWVSALARKHASVLEEAMQHGPVVPAPLCTLFSSEQALRESLSRGEQGFLSKLERLKGRQEWGCKIFCDTSKLEAHVSKDDAQLVALEAAAAAASPGQAFVLRKKRDAHLARLVSERIDAVTDEILDSLAGLSVDTRLRTLLSEATTGRSEAMVLNVALLVATPRYSELNLLVDDLAARFGGEGFQIDLTGPWPPYTFSDDEEASPLVDEESPDERC